MHSAPIEPYAVTFRAFAEEHPASAWRAHFSRHWPVLRAVLRSLEPARLSPLRDAALALRVTMPELFPVWQRLVELAGGDPLAARVLTLADTPHEVGGCTQGVIKGALVRNYDFNPEQFEATIWLSRLTERRVIGVTAGLWGLLDGVNDAGLSVSAAFGGQRLSGPGFAIPLVVRYLLEICTSVDEVAERLPGLPSSEAYNVTVAEAGGDGASFFLTPGEPPRRAADAVVANHQETVTWPEHAAFSRTLQRQHALRELVNAVRADGGAEGVDTVASAMLRPPLYCTDYARSFGTLYTAVYQPAGGVAEYRWPGDVWRQSFDAFVSGERRVVYAVDVPIETPNGHGHAR